MSIKVRMTLLLGTLLLAFLTALEVLRVNERAQTKMLVAESQQATQQLVEKWILFVNEPLRRFGQDFSKWPEMERFLGTRDAGWAETNLQRNLANYDAHAIWVIGESGAVVYSAQQSAGPPLDLPLNLAGFIRPVSSRASRHFYLESRDGLLEIWSEPIGPADTQAVPAGWLLVSRLWDGNFLSTLSRLAEIPLQLTPGDTTAGAGPGRLMLNLPDLGGATTRQLQARLPDSNFAGILANDTLAPRLLVLFGLLVVLTVWLGVQQWVLRPLQQIGLSLAHEDPGLIQTLGREKNELGRVARLVETSFEQKLALQAENEERKRAEQALRKSEELGRRSLELRARLARDLHDGVIQSIYAAGLGLESAMSELERDQAAAHTRLSHCRQSLNDVIREVRGFISGLEPEQMQRHGFAQELAALASTMQALWPVRIVPKVDALAAGRLTIGQEVHALQIARECISNALRHGEAKKVFISLTRSAGEGVLTVRDDGRGFEPGLVSGQGSGLNNLAARAREMGGQLRLDSQPGRGATVSITFPLAEVAS